MADESRRQFTLEELTFLFATLERLGSPCVLMGGQAAIFWARRYARAEPALREIEEVFPFVSKDVDFQGSREAVIAFARAMGQRAEVPGFREAFGNLMAGKFSVRVGDDRLSVEVLWQVPGISEHEVRKLSVLELVGGHSVRVLNPVAMLLAKTWNVVKITKEGRHDTEQLLSLVPCVRAHIREFLREGLSDRRVLRAGLSLLEHAIHFTELPGGRKAAERCGVDWSQILPHSFIAASTLPELARLREKRVPLWLRNVSNYQRPAPENPTVRRLLEILAAHAEPLCSQPAPPNRKSKDSQRDLNF